LISTFTIFQALFKPLAVGVTRDSYVASAQQRVNEFGAGWSGVPARVMREWTAIAGTAPAAAGAAPAVAGN